MPSHTGIHGFDCADVSMVPVAEPPSYEAVAAESAEPPRDAGKWDLFACANDKIVLRYRH